MELEIGMLIQPVNTTDWDRYEAGAFDTAPEVTDAAVWDDVKHIALLAEPLGFDALWITEHHRTPYGMSPNPLQFLAYIAGQTERIDLGSAVVVLPWHDPVRVAEDIAQLDNLAGDRRIRIGFGRGAAASEFEHLRVDQATARERFDESVQIIRAALTQEQFSFDGDVFQVPETTLRPRPRHPELVDDFFCAFVGEPSLRAAARAGLGMCFNVAKPNELVRADVDLFNGIRAEQGLGPVGPMIVQQMVCAETDEEAEAAGLQYMMTYLLEAGRHYHVDKVAGVKGYEHYSNVAEHFDPDVLSRAIWGTPERCLARIQELQEETGVAHLLVCGWFGGMPVAEAERSLRLFSSEVLPKLNRAGASASAR